MMPQLDLNDIKTQIKSILDTANIVAGDPIDLSKGMAARVRRVMKVNLNNIPIQPSFFPCLTVFIDSKDITIETVGRDRAIARRSATVSVKLAGIVWEQITANIDVDPADEEIEKLMENTEEILRSNYDLNSTVFSNAPNAVTYHSVANDEETHLRIGILDLTVKKFY